MPRAFSCVQDPYGISIKRTHIVLHTGDGGHQVFEPIPEGADVYALPMQRWAVAVRDAVRNGAVDPGTPTFADGLACAQVMDRMRG